MFLRKLNGVVSYRTRKTLLLQSLAMDAERSMSGEVRFGGFLHTAEDKRHHVEERGFFSRAKFRNPWKEWKDPSLGDVLKMVAGGLKSRKSSFSPKLIGNDHPTEQDLKEAFPIEQIDRSRIDHPEAGKVQATWIGHSTVLVQMGDVCNILTDPIFEHTCSPVAALSPKRVVEPAISIDSLPRIDAVVISHGHYDHLCEKSIIRLHKKFKDIEFFVPLGHKKWFLRRNIKNVKELDWWDSAEFCRGAIKFTCTPAMHWSMRRVWDRNTALWGSWHIENVSDNTSFWFAGDTGYSEELFKEIGRRCHGIDCAAIPIGAYNPRWFMRPQHINPEEAVLVHKHILAKKSLAIHHATFSLTSEPLDEPPVKLVKALLDSGLDPDSFQAVPHGSTMIS